MVLTLHVAEPTDRRRHGVLSDADLRFFCDGESSLLLPSHNALFNTSVGSSASHIAYTVIADVCHNSVPSERRTCADCTVRRYLY